MSLFKSIGGFLKKAVGVVAPAVTGFLTGGPVGAGAGLVAALTGRGGGGGGMGAPAVMPTLPAVMPGAGFMQQVGGLARQALTGAVPGMAGVRKTKVGKLTGNPIPAGYVEKMSPTGVVYLGKVSKRRGITARDLRSFRRVHRLVASIQRKTYHRKGGK